MPSGDRTGPMGQGSMTGRGLGYCEGHDSPGYEKGFGGRGRGYRFGRRMGPSQIHRFRQQNNIRTVFCSLFNSICSSFQVFVFLPAFNKHLRHGKPKGFLFLRFQRSAHQYE